MTVNPNERFKSLETESKLVADQIKAEKINDIDNFFESEKKKYKKTDEIEDLLNNYNKKS